MNNWYIVKGDQTAGPYPAGQLVDLATAERWSPDTLVWRDGLSGWAPLSQLWSDIAAEAAGASSGPAPAPAPSSPQPQAVPSGAASPQYGPPPGAQPADPQFGPPPGGQPTGPQFGPPGGQPTGPQYGPPPGGNVYGPPPGAMPGGVPGAMPGGMPAGAAGGYGPGGIGQLRPRGNAIGDLAGMLYDVAGVERVQGFNIKALFSEAFKRHGVDEIDRRFATGTPETTPGIMEIETGWPKPWLFVRMLLGAVVIYVGFRVIFATSDNPNMIGPLIIVGSFAVPLATLIFFYELNTPRNFSAYRLIHSLFAGALLSLAFAIILFQAFPSLTESIGAPIAGLFEETAKLAAVILITFRLDPRRYPWMLNGLLFGAAVGTGFAVFESSGYAVRALVGAGIDEMNHTVVLRGLLSPFGHIVWTALAAGALWRAKADQPFSLKLLADKRVLRVIPLVMLLHATWDYDKIPEGPFFLKYIVLGVIAWALVISLLQSGLKQIVVAQQTLASQGHAQVTGSTTLLGGVGPIGGPAGT